MTNFNMDWIFRLIFQFHHNLIVSSCCNYGPQNWKKKKDNQTPSLQEESDSPTRFHSDDESVEILEDIDL